MTSIPGWATGPSWGTPRRLHSGGWVPAGERWHGSPAQPTSVDYLRVPPLRCGTFRRLSAAFLTLLEVFFIVMPLVQGGLEMVLSTVPSIAELVQPGRHAVGTPDFFADAAVFSLALFGGGVVLGWIVVMTVPRFLNLFLRPEKVYPLYGMAFRINHAITRMTNVKFFTQLFGNSSYSAYYLRRLGYHLFRIKQTGSNFGDEVAHDNPYLCSVGRGTVIADGLSMVNTEFSSTSMRFSRVSIGPRNFLGNNIAYPPQGRTGDNCLLATKVMVPLDGPIREGVGLLGSPAFEIPRSVERDNQFNQQQSGQDLRRKLSRKNRYNLRTMGVFLFVRWLHLFLVTLLGMAAADLYEVLDHAVVGAFLALSVLLSAVVLRPRRALLHCIPSAAASAVLLLRAVFLVARAPVEGTCRHLSQRLQRNPLQDFDLALAGCPTGPRSLRRRLLSDGADPGLHRRPCHAECGQQGAVPLAGGRRLQIRPHEHRRRLHARSRLVRPLRRDDGRRRRPRPGLLPDERRNGAAGRPAGAGIRRQPLQPSMSSAPMTRCPRYRWFVPVAAITPGGRHSQTPACRRRNGAGPAARPGVDPRPHRFWLGSGSRLRLGPSTCSWSGLGRCPGAGTGPGSGPAWAPAPAAGPAWARTGAGSDSGPAWAHDPPHLLTRPRTGSQPRVGSTTRTGSGMCTGPKTDLGSRSRLDPGMGAGAGTGPRPRSVAPLPVREWGPTPLARDEGWRRRSCTGPTPTWATAPPPMWAAAAAPVQAGSRPGTRSGKRARAAPCSHPTDWPAPLTSPAAEQ